MSWPCRQPPLRRRPPPILQSVQPFDRIEDPAKLRRLLQAIVILDRELNLPMVLRRIIEEACDLVDAEYGALGRVDRGRRALEQFLTVGLTGDRRRPSGCARRAGASSAP